QFARMVDGQLVLDPNNCYFGRGFQPGQVYELTYTAVGAPVIGLAFAGFRDAASFLKWGSAEDGNPVAGTLTHAYGWGHSMNGRWLREFLYWASTATSMAAWCSMASCHTLAALDAANSISGL